MHEAGHGQFDVVGELLSQDRRGLQGVVQVGERHLAGCACGQPVRRERANPDPGHLGDFDGTVGSRRQETLDVVDGEGHPVILTAPADRDDVWGLGEFGGIDAFGAMPT